MISGLLLHSLLLLQAGAPSPEDQPQFNVRQKTNRLSSLDLIRRFEGAPETIYHLGTGDEITIEVWNRPELSGKHIVGPDGFVSMPLIGSVKVGGLSRDEAPAKIAGLYATYYENPSVMLRIDRYVSNRIFILGRVHSPGALQFESQPTLLDVITRAGSLPIGGVGADKAALSRCAIFRGRDQILWVDLRQILNEGNLAYNILLRRDDLVYIPDSDDQLVYVLGETGHPGAFHLTPSMSLMDALAQAGGPTPNASLAHIYLIRPRQNLKREINLKDVFALRQNPAIQLEEGDIIYVPKTGLAKLGYVLQQVAPLTGFAVFGSIIAP
jgi:polysaccharide biosynthesis/export protein